MTDATIIFVSSNREEPEFEAEIIKTLKKNSGGLPIIAVTQKPVDIEQNLVVGDVGASGFNFCRQVQLGVLAAKTRFVISAESDCIYPKDYFEFRPQFDDICYRNTNIYVQKYRKHYACKKTRSTFSQVVGREFYLERFDLLFKGQPEWSTEMKNFPKEIGMNLFDEFVHWETKYPAVSFKTGRGMRNHSNTDEVPNSHLDHIPSHTIHTTSSS